MEGANNNNIPHDVLFFGDSITWGMAHKYTGRYDTSWPRMLERRLNHRGYNMVESALCSRTTTLDDPFENDWLTGGEPHFFNGLAHLIPEFLSHNCRAVVILLGTNDLKVRIRSQTRLRGRMDAQSIATACSKLGLLLRKAHSESPRLKDHPFSIIFVAPPVVRLNALSKELGYDELSVKISHDFPAAYRKMCKENNFDFVYVKGLDMEQSVDGVHVTPEASRQIAESVWDVLERVLEKRKPLRKNITVSEGEESTYSRDSNTSFSNEEDGNSVASSDSTISRGAASQQRRQHQQQQQLDGRYSRAREERIAQAKKQKTSTQSEDTLRKPDEEILKDLTWSQCRECGKWRMTNRATAGKSLWTCKDEFWSQSLQEWKIGCGWSADPWKYLGNDYPAPPIGAQEVITIVDPAPLEETVTAPSPVQIVVEAPTNPPAPVVVAAAAPSVASTSPDATDQASKPLYRGRGRPPGSKNTKPSVSTGLPRGRPPGSHNKPKPGALTAAGAAGAAAPPGLPPKVVVNPHLQDPKARQVLIRQIPANLFP